MNLLLVEPDNILGKIYKVALKDIGHRVMCSHSAQDAIICADKRLPDLIVLELQMPGHSGIEFLYELRSYPDWQNVPVIVHTLISPRDMESHMLRLKQLGVIQYLYKPATSLRQLLRSVSEIPQLV